DRRLLVLDAPGADLLQPELVLRRRAPALAVVGALQRRDRELALAVTGRAVEPLLRAHHELARLVALTQVRTVLDIGARGAQAVVHPAARRGDLVDRVVREAAARVRD